MTDEVENYIDEMYSLAWQDGHDGLNRRDDWNTSFQQKISSELTKEREEKREQDAWNQLVIKLPNKVCCSFFYKGVVGNISASVGEFLSDRVYGVGSNIPTKIIHLDHDSPTPSTRKE